MFRSHKIGILRAGWLAIGFVICLTVNGLSQQGPTPAQRARRAAKARSNYHHLTTVNARSPGYTKKGELRRLSPDQLWDIKPDSTRPNRGPFRLLVYASLGASYYSSILNSPVTLTDKKQLRWSIPFSLRVMWQTDHRMRLGMETGYVNMYKYQGNRNGELAQVRVSATPILAVFSMAVVKRFSLYAGTGPYRINSNLEYDGDTQGTTYSLGWMVAGTYTQPLGKNIGLAAELKWYDATQTKDACFIAQATLVWRALTW